MKMTEGAGQHHRAVLAEMLTSAKIGLSHIRLIGELLIAQADLNEWLNVAGKRTLSPDDWVSFAERVLECEEAYQNAWNVVGRAHDEMALRDGLVHLETTLRNAISTLESLRLR